MNRSEHDQADVRGSDDRIDPETEPPIVPERGHDPVTPVMASDRVGTSAGGKVDDVEPVESTEPLASAIDGASRPDKVAIGMMVGVVVLLLICVAFAFAAR